VLGDKPGGLVEVDPQVDAGIKHRDRLGGRVVEFPLGQLGRGGIEPDELQGVSLKLAPDQRLQGQGDPFGLTVFVEPGHRPRHVHQHHRGATRLILGGVDDQIFLLDRELGPGPLPGQGVPHGFMQIQIRDRIAKLVRLRFVELCLARPALIGVVPTQFVPPVRLKQFLERLRPRPPDRLGSDPELPLFIPLEKALLHQQLKRLGIPLLQLGELIKDLLAVVHEVVVQLLKQGVRRLRGERLTAVPL